MATRRKTQSIPTKELYEQYNNEYLKTINQAAYNEFITSKRFKSEGLWASPLNYKDRKDAISQLKVKAVNNKVEAVSFVACGKCKSNNVTYEFVQFRAADEAQDIVYVCSSCGNRWKGR